MCTSSHLSLVIFRGGLKFSPLNIFLAVAHEIVHLFFFSRVVINLSLLESLVSFNYPLCRSLHVFSYHPCTYKRVPWFIASEKRSLSENFVQISCFLIVQKLSLSKFE